MWFPSQIGVCDGECVSVRFGEHPCVTLREGGSWPDCAGDVSAVTLLVQTFVFWVVHLCAGLVGSLKETDASSVFTFESEAGFVCRHARSSEAQVRGSGNGNAHSGAH